MLFGSHFSDASVKAQWTCTALESAACALNEGVRRKDLKLGLYKCIASGFVRRKENTYTRKNTVWDEEEGG